MPDDISLAQLGVFTACARMGGFSAAARKLGCTQSMISNTIAKLEVRLGVMLFDRSTRLPLLTDHGRALLVHAQVVMHCVDDLRARASSFALGTEAELSIAVDAMLPARSLTRAVESFREKFPCVPLHVHVGAPGAVAEMVLTRRCRIGVLGPLSEPSEALVFVPILNVAAVTIVSRTHALAGHRDRVPRSLIEKQVQLVVSDRAALAEGTNLRAMSSQTWQVADMQLRREFLCAGFGWGCMPMHLVEQDIAMGRLAEIEIEGLTRQMLSIELSSVCRRDLPPGLAGQFLLEQLASGAAPSR